MADGANNFSSESKEGDEDDLIDAFIEAAKRDPNRLTEENWETEIEKVPLFMTKPISPSQEMSPELSAIQSLIYNSDDPNESARAYKEEGTELYKKGEYRSAINSYTEGLKHQINDVELKAQILNNRSASHAYLGNHRSALEDASSAVSLQPDYLKAISRCAVACHSMGRCREALEWCEKGLFVKQGDEKLLDIKLKCEQEIETDAINRKKKTMEEEIKRKEAVAIIKAIHSREIKVGGSITGLDTPHIEKQGEFRVVLESDGSLSWPIVLLYPETQQSDLIARFNENSTLGEQLEAVLSESPGWDTEGRYHVESVKVAVLMEGENQYFNVKIEQTLLSILKHPKYILTSLAPSFYLHCKIE